MRKFAGEPTDFDERLHAVYDEANAFRPEALDVWLSAIRVYLDDGSRVVDVGAGTGLWSEILARHLDTAVVAVEPSDRMRAVAEERHAHPRVRYQVGRAESLPVGDGWADVVWMSRVVGHIADLPAAAAEAARVVRAGGWCVIIATFGDRVPLDTGLPRFWPRLPEIAARRYPTARDVLEPFVAAGFSDIALEPVREPIDPTLSDYRRRAVLEGLSLFDYLTDDEFDAGLRAIDEAIATEGDDQWVFEQIDMLVLRRRPAPEGPAPAAEMATHFRPGGHILVQGVLTDATVADDLETVCDAKPVVVVEDGDDRTMLWLPAGTPTRRPIGLVPGLPHPWRRGESVVVPGVWAWCSALWILQHTRWAQYWVLWAPHGAFMGWMVDLDPPPRRTATGFQAREGKQLDLMVDANRRWRWKDRNELARAVDLGFVTPEESDAAYAEAERVIAEIEAAQWPFTDEWRDWRPDPGWAAPAGPPPDWWRIA